MSVAPLAGFGWLASATRVDGPGSGTDSTRGSQPRSRNTGSVRSMLLVKSGLIAGSISRFGVHDTSKCDTLEPLWNGFGAYMSTWPFALRPEISVGLSRIVTVVGPPAIAVLSVAPSACDSASTGIVIEGSEPDGENPPATLFTSRQPTAPCCCAFSTLFVKLHVPRLMTAILPVSWALFVIG